MNRSILMLSVTVKDGERAFLTRNGRFERVLEPGLHRLFDPLREFAAEVLTTVRSEFPADRYAVLKAELESIERLVEKVGRIDLHAGDSAGLDALLTRLVRLQRPEAAPERV